jgi:hypothetical protein
MKKVMRDQGGECWFDLHHTWPNGQVWVLISRPDRGRPARVWLVGPRRTVPIRGGGGQGLKRRGSPPSRHPTPNPRLIEREALPAAGSATAFVASRPRRPRRHRTSLHPHCTDSAASPPVAALAQNLHRRRDCLLLELVNQARRSGILPLFPFLVHISIISCDGLLVYTKKTKDLPTRSTPRKIL